MTSVSVRVSQSDQLISIAQTHCKLGVVFVGDFAGETFAIFLDDTFAIFLVIRSTFIILGKLVLVN